MALAPALFIHHSAKVLRSDLPTINPDSARPLVGNPYEADAAGHWLFSQDSACLVSRQSSDVLTLQDTPPVYASNYLTTGGFGKALLSPYDDALAQTMCVVFQRPATGGNKLFFGAFRDAQQGSGMYQTGGGSGTGPLVRSWNHSPAISIDWPDGLEVGDWVFAGISEDYPTAKKVITYIGGQTPVETVYGTSKTLALDEGTGGETKVAIGNAWYGGFDNQTDVNVAEFIYYTSPLTILQFDAVYARSKTRMDNRGLELF